MKKAVFTMLLAGALSAAHAQTDTSILARKDTAAVATPKAKSYWKLSLGYLTNSVYNGRRDSLLTPYITPTLGYYDKSGFFADGSLSYLARAGSGRIDVATLEAGYDFSLGNFDGEVMGSKLFYNSSSTNTSSEISASLMASAAYDFGFIHPTLAGTASFGKNTDYAVAFSLDHTFYAVDDKFTITPTAMVNASTQNYYGSYFNNRRYAKLRKNVYYDITADLTDASRFKLLDYEFSVPLEYTIKKIKFGVTPYFAIPVNPAVVTVNMKSSQTSATISKTVTEKTANVFFASFEITYKL